MLLHFVLVLHFAAIVITFCVSITFCGDYYILRRNTRFYISVITVTVGVPLYLYALILFYLSFSLSGRKVELDKCISMDK